MSVDAAEDIGRAAVGARLHSLITEWVDAGALQAEEQSWTWGDVGVVVRSLDVLLREREVPEAAPVVVVMRQRPVMVAVELAVLAAGRTAVLASALLGDAGLVADVAGIAPAVVVAHSDDWSRQGFAEMAGSSGAFGVEIDDSGSLRVRCEGSLVLPSGPQLGAAVTVLTSGTTGAPKRLPVPWRSFVDLGGGAPGRQPQHGRGALILSLPLVTLGGMLSVARLVFGGRPMAMMEYFDVRKWASLVKRHHPSVIGAPPPVVKMILDAGITSDHFAGVTAFITSSAPVAPELVRAFEETYGFPVLVGYGATEFLTSVTGWTSALWEEFGAAKLGSVGRALPGVRLRVVDTDTGAELATDVEGVLEVDPPQRAATLAEGWLRTADRARIDSDGFVWILGRADDVIIRGGFKVDLRQVESALRRHPAVVDALALALPDDRLGAVPAVVVVQRHPEDVSSEDLIASTRDILPVYAVPVAIRTVDSIPLTSTLKPSRAEAATLFSG